MAKPKIAIVFYSTYGTNHEVAAHAAEVAEAAGAEVRLRRVAETAPQAAIDSQDAWKAQVARAGEIPVVTADDMEWADGYWVSCPTRYGSAASQLRAFTDTLGGLWMQGKLANKTVTATSSAQNPNGGVETTILGLYTTFCHWGCVIVPPGYTDQSIFGATGCPYGYVTTGGKFDDKGRAAVAHQARRLVEMTAKLAA
jgi:NAD(P)H dehydrogenase (quinone)